MEMKNCYRDITIKEITEQYIGQTLRVAGWVENIRDHGGVSFVDLERYVWCAAGGHPQNGAFKGTYQRNLRQHCGPGGKAG